MMKTTVVVILVDRAVRLLGHRSYYCGAFEPAYQSGPDGLLRTLNCCPCVGEEHAEQFGDICTVPQQPPGLTRNPGGYEVTLAERNAA